MARLLRPEDFKRESLLERSRGEYLDSDLRVAYSGGTPLNPAVLHTPEITWTTGTTMGLMVDAVSMRPDDELRIVGFVSQPKVQARLEIPFLISKRQAHRQRDMIEQAEGFRMNSLRLIKRFYPLNAVKMALEHSGPALGFKLPDFDTWLWYEVKRNFGALLGARVRKEPKQKCDLCDTPCPTGGDEKGICPNCGHESFNFSDEAFWRDRVSSDDDSLVIKVGDPDPDQKVLYNEILSKVENPQDRWRVQAWAHELTAKERARKMRSNPSRERVEIHRIIASLRKII